MSWNPVDDIEDRIEAACRDYVDPDTDTDVFDLERRIERAWRMEYDAEDVLYKFETMVDHYGTAPCGSGQLQVYGKDVELGDTVSFVDLFDRPHPYDLEIDPWESE